jgi:preprotein translocase subunit SecY
MQKPAGIVSIPKIPELKNRLLFTILMLAIYRIGIFIPIPGVDVSALKEFFARAEGTLLGLFNLFSGGAMENASVFALGVMPYITSSIIMEVVSSVFPRLQELKKQGELGRQKINQYTRYLTVFLCFFQGMFWAFSLEQTFGAAGSLAIKGGMLFRITSGFILLIGTMSLMWIGELITKKGIGNGISLIIFAGIVTRLPGTIGNTISLLQLGEMNAMNLIMGLILMVLVVAFIVYMESAHRRIPIQYATRIMGRKIAGGVASYLPIKLNISGVIPPIFASSILMFPLTFATFIQTPFTQKFADILNPLSPLYNILYFILIMFFAFFYTGIIFNPYDIAENLQKAGAFIPGIRPGKQTAEYLDGIITRLTFMGGIYLGVICVLPTFFIGGLNLPFMFGGTALLIVIGVAMDTIRQIEALLFMSSYEGLFGKEPAVRGRTVGL